MKRTTFQFFAILLLVHSGCKNSTKDLDRTMEIHREIHEFGNSLFSKCGDSYFSKRGKEYCEYKEPNFLPSLNFKEVTEIQKLNGVEWETKAFFIAKAYRCATTPIKLQQSEWKEFNTNDFNVRKIKGKLQFSVDGSSEYGGVALKKVNCAEISTSHPQS